MPTWHTRHFNLDYTYTLPPLCLVMHYYIQLTQAPPRPNFNSKLGLGHFNNVSVKETHVDNPNIFPLYTKTHQLKIN